VQLLSLKVPPQRIPQVLNSALHHWAESMVSFTRDKEGNPGAAERPTSGGEINIGGVDGEVLRHGDRDRREDDDAGLTHGEVCGKVPC